MAKKKKKKSTGKSQKKQQKHAAKRKQKNKRLARMRSIFASSARLPSLRQAASWPLHEVLITEDWRDPMTFTQVLIVRKGPDGLYAVALALVDQACMGVKTAFSKVVDKREYRQLRSELTSIQKLSKGDINLAAKIIRESVAYARSFGIKPDPDIAQTQILLQGADPDACHEPIPLGGPEGKPTFIAGPYDNIPKIIKTLEKHLGPDGFHVLLPLMDDEDFFDDDFFDDYDEDFFDGEIIDDDDW